MLNNVMLNNVIPGLTRDLIKAGIAGQARNDEDTRHDEDARHDAKSPA